MATRSSTTKPDAPAEPEAPAVPKIGSAFSDLLGEAARDVVGWIPEREGDVIAGLVVGDEIISTSFVDSETGETVRTDLPVSVLDVDPTRPELPYVRFVWMGTVLLNAYRRHRPTRLDKVAVRMTRKSGGGGVGDYDDFRVVVHKAPENDRPDIEVGTPVRSATVAKPPTANGGDPGPLDPGEEAF